MAAKFINSINLDEAENVSAVKLCQEAINHYLFYQYTLLPAMLITLAHAFTEKRESFLRHVFHGRPGLIYPMDSLTRMSRLSYACAFGATAHLVYQVVVNQTFAIDVSGINPSLTSFVAICSMFIYGMVFFPLFSSLALSSVFSLSLGALYVWMLMTVEIYRVFECSTSVRGRFLLLLRELPSLVCLGFLSISIPIRLIRAARQRRYFFQDEEQKEIYDLQEIRQSYVGHHVVMLFKKPEIIHIPEGRKARIISMLMNLAKTIIYRRKKGFLYPARIVSVMFVATLIIYMLSLEILSLIPRLLDRLTGPIVDLVAQQTGSYLFLEIGRLITDSFIVATVFSIIFAIFNVLHSLSNYRANLFALYRADHSCIPPAFTQNNASYCVNSIKYAGFQVGFIVWGFILHCVVLWILAILCGSFILLLKEDFTFWPIIVIFIIVTIGQTLLAKFVFLQDRGQHLALNNRRSYFNFTYFMFFYNIFLSLFSCLLRIIKAIVIGMAIIGRLDTSSLPRRFEFFDPGFQAYVGFMQMEAAHTHPVVIVFIHLLMLGLQNKKNRKIRDFAAAYDSGDQQVKEKQRQKSAAARFNWHVIYTLLHNPDLRVTRKGYIQILHQARLLGLVIPVSDRQGDIDLEALQQAIADNKNVLTKKNHNTADEESVEMKQLVVIRNEIES